MNEINNKQKVLKKSPMPCAKKYYKKAKTIEPPHVVADVSCYLILPGGRKMLSADVMPSQHRVL